VWKFSRERGGALAARGTLGEPGLEGERGERGGEGRESVEEPREELLARVGVAVVWVGRQEEHRQGTQRVYLSLYQPRRSTSAVSMMNRRYFVRCLPHT
jgi:hypothetical protein